MINLLLFLGEAVDWEENCCANWSAVWAMGQGDFSC